MINMDTKTAQKQLVSLITEHLSDSIPVTRILTYKPSSNGAVTGRFESSGRVYNFIFNGMDARYKPAMNADSALFSDYYLERFDAAPKVASGKPRALPKCTSKSYSCKGQKGVACIPLTNHCKMANTAIGNERLGKIKSMSKFLAANGEDATKIEATRAKIVEGRMALAAENRTKREPKPTTKSREHSNRISVVKELLGSNPVKNNEKILGIISDSQKDVDKVNKEFNKKASRENYAILEEKQADHDLLVKTVMEARYKTEKTNTEQQKPVVNKLTDEQIEAKVKVQEPIPSDAVPDPDGLGVLRLLKYSPKPQNDQEKKALVLYAVKNYLANSGTGGAKGAMKTDLLTEALKKQLSKKEILGLLPTRSNGEVIFSEDLKSEKIPVSKYVESLPKEKSVISQKQFQDIASEAIKKAPSQFASIANVRDSLGNNVSREDFARWLNGMQSKDLIHLRTGGTEMSDRDKHNSLSDDLRGLITHMTVPNRK